MTASPFHSFLAAEHGAITVDWTTLTAMAVSLSLATTVALGAILNDISEEVNMELFDRTATEGANTFDFGADGWTMADGSDALTSFVDGFGYIMGPIGSSGGQQVISTTMGLPEGLASATANFDVLAIDSLDGEDFVIYVNDLEVGRITAGWEITYSATPVVGLEISIDFDVTVLQQNADIGGNRNDDESGAWWWRDGAANVNITLDNPGTEFKVGFGSTANQDITDESWGVDNFGVTGAWPDEEDDESGDAGGV
ncbi:hypothetical protein JQC91_11765 [Jannaschia sp. Os4]|uniref:hypothetical protein n=1 Tax=Jannaschia sp. Os4 TaxID=2807617 RepID=UPI00193A0C71|nr:hypothetical protein [Jannaschia sp. Os4]MBM2576976.1 hypothetical protein [Jannaschia sp. Os4]